MLAGNQHHNASGRGARGILPDESVLTLTALKVSFFIPR